MDGLSGAASIAGIVSLSVQLAESIHKLCKFLIAFRHASEDVEDIIDDLEVLTCVLVEIQRCEELFGPQHATAKALLRCRRQVQALDNMVNDWKGELEKESRWRRSQASLKFVVKADNVKEWRKKISEAKETLSLALQASSSRVQYTQLMTITRLDGQMTALSGQASCIQTLVEGSSGSGSPCPSLARPAASSILVTSPASGSHNSVRNPTCELSLRMRSRRARFYPSDRSCNSWAHGLLGTIEYQSRKAYGAASEEEEELVDILFKPAWWLQKLGFSTIFEAHIERSSRSRLKVSLWTENPMPPDVETRVISAICSGNIQILIEMLSTKVIDIHSVFSTDFTLLQVAVMYAQPEICAFLIKAGVSLEAQNPNNISAFHSVVFPHPSRGKLHLEIMQMFTSAGLDLLDLSLEHTIFTIVRMGDHEDTAGELGAAPCWLFDNLLLVLDYCDQPTVDSAWAMVLGFACLRPGPALLRYALSKIDNITYKRALFMHKFCSLTRKVLVDIWLDALGPLNFLDRDGRLGRVGPLSLYSMYTPLGVIRLRDLLRMGEVPIEEFVKDEIPLLKKACKDEQGVWTEEKLLNLFTWEFAETFGLDEENPRAKVCKCCERPAWLWANGPDNVLWTLGLCQIKDGKSPDGPFEGEAEQAYGEWRRYHDRCRTETVCKDCQVEKQTTSLGEENLAPSPFRLDI